MYFNAGDGLTFDAVPFGEEGDVTYGVDLGDANGDGFLDIAVANSTGRNYVVRNNPAG